MVALMKQKYTTREIIESFSSHSEQSVRTMLEELVDGKNVRVHLICLGFLEQMLKFQTFVAELPDISPDVMQKFDIINKNLIEIRDAMNSKWFNEISVFNQVRDIVSPTLKLLIFLLKNKK